MFDARQTCTGVEAYKDPCEARIAGLRVWAAVAQDSQSHRGVGNRLSARSHTSGHGSSVWPVRGEEFAGGRDRLRSGKLADLCAW